MNKHGWVTCSLAGGAALALGLTMAGYSGGNGAASRPENEIHNLLGVILPTAAFALPICTIILSGTMTDITPELYEAMAMDGATPARSFLRLVLPLSKGGLSTIAVFSALQAWNGFLFPLILTQSESTRVVTLGLFNFQTQFGINIPGLLAAVTLSMVPVLLVYLFARRALVQGLMGAGGK